MDEQAALALDQVSVSMPVLRLLGSTVVLMVIVLLMLRRCWLPFLPSPRRPRCWA